MEFDDEGRNSSPEDKNPKRRMKTPFQLEALERVYAEDRYPTETVRAELSFHLNLSDKQLQMWFCHRRLKDRKGKDDEMPPGRKKLKTERLGPSSQGHGGAALENDVLDDGNRIRHDAYNDEFEFEEENYRGVIQGSSNLHLRKGSGQEPESVPLRRNQVLVGKVSSPRITAESAAIAAVESRLGKLWRADGPILAVHFDPLPSGGVSSLKEYASDKKVTTVPEHQYNDKDFEQQETRPTKAGGFGLPPLPAIGMTRKAAGLPRQQNLSTQNLPRTPREFQFLSDQSTAKEDYYKKPVQVNLHSNSERSHELIPTSRVGSLSPMGGPFLPTNLSITAGEGYCHERERVPNVAISLFMQRENRATGLYTPHGLDSLEARQQGVYHFDVDGQMGVCQSALQGIGTSQPFGGSESLAHFQEHEQARVDKKRKIEEMKVAKESEAHVKRMRRDLERQENSRRKKEEQTRKEMEKQDRDKRKEEERALREKQKEEERLQREVRREIERQEKMVLKENKKMEKQHRKEEMRKAKEAARLKAITERAAARKLSKESADTVDDEQLELLEAATMQGLFSINGLEDGDPQMMDMSNVVLKKFPPSAVQMKVLMSGSPWNESEQAVGHFFMLWKFLTTFADVIGLWSFTIDEFAQALHDHDSRLLCEIHVSLIKMMVKNIEDAAQAAGSGAIGSQNAIALASGGHPQIVEAAFEWGFDIQEWGHFVNPITWPEILRQFALAAGYGPKWRKCSKDSSPPKEDVEEQSEENAVTILRSGAAAASAVALMQGKGVGHLRRCRYRLTPGTVKYAAFHILSLEGSKGLTILEVAEKIQKSGLRDLTTSKTPEASIAAALSRDMNLFERVAPSTYCVRPAFRKDLDDTEEVLQSARERIRLFQSGFLDVEEAEKETDETEEVERDEDYDSDGQDVEDGDIDTGLPKEVDVKDELQAEQALNPEPVIDEEMEIDESQVGEPWVQGLMEGEYADLSVEERLMALVALVDVVNEGYGIRLALETRMEAASALKRQMWTEAQIERRRHKEDQLSRLQPALLAPRNEGDDGVLVGAEPAPVSTVEEPTESEAKTREESPLELNLVPSDLSHTPDCLATIEPSLLSQETNLEIHDKNPLSQDGLVLQEATLAPGHQAERPRTQMKANVGMWAEELYMIRSHPLGLDRRRNRFWQFSTFTGGQDPSEGRIYFESSSDGHWGVIDTEEALDALMRSLDVRGTKEAALHAALVKLEASLRSAMRASSACGSCFDGSGTDARPQPADPGRDFEGVGGDGGCGVLYDSTVESIPLRGLEEDSLEERGAIAINLGETDAEKCSLFERFKDFEQWMWSEHFRTLSGLRVAKPGRKRESDLLSLCSKCHNLYWTTDKYCQLCHSSPPKTQSKQDSYARESEERMKGDAGWKLSGTAMAVPPRIQILKADICSIEALLPYDVCKELWDHQRRKAWASLLKGANKPTELLQSLAELECRVQEDWLSSHNSNKEALSASSRLSAKSEGHPWVPHTSAAVGLHVMAFGAALASSSDEKKRRQKHEDGDQENVMHPSIGAPVSKGKSDLPAADKQEEDDDDAPLGDASGSRGRGRGQGGRKSRGGIRSSRTGKVGVRRAPKSKLQSQEEHTVAATTDVKQGARGAGRGQGRSRGRPRGRSTGRARGRGSRGGRTSQNSARRKEKLRKEKNPNELVTEESNVGKLFEQSPVLEDDPDGEPESEDDVFSKSEWEESEDPFEGPQDLEDEDNMGGTVEEDGDDEVPPEDADEDGQGDDGDEDDEDRSSGQNGAREEEVEEAGRPGWEEEDEDPDRGAEFVNKSDED